MTTTRTSLRRTALALTTAASGLLGLVGAPTVASAAPPAAAAPAPKAEAVSAIDWGMGFCGMALDSSTRSEEVPKLYKKFTEKRDAAVAADPSIRSWDGVKRNKKVSEWLPRCEKEIPARIERESHGDALKGAIEAALRQCDRVATDAGVAEYKKLKAQAVAINKSENFTYKDVNLTDVNGAFAACDKSTVAAVAAEKADEAARIARQQQRDKDNEDKLNAEADAKRARTKSLRDSVKGDRRKIWDKYGEPTYWEGDLNKSVEWRYTLPVTRGAYEGNCDTLVRFKGDKKISEKESGYACQLR